MSRYKKSDIIKCMVTAIESYGFFVSTENGTSGLVHISELSTGYVTDVSTFVKKGDIIYAQILDINEDKNTLKLSIKNINYNAGKKKVLEDDSTFGFVSLSDALPKWINAKLKEIDSIDNHS